MIKIYVFHKINEDAMYSIMNSIVAIYPLLDSSHSSSHLVTAYPKPCIDGQSGGLRDTACRLSDERDKLAAAHAIHFLRPTHE